MLTIRCHDSPRPGELLHSPPSLPLPPPHVHHMLIGACKPTLPHAVFPIHVSAGSAQESTPAPASAQRFGRDLLAYLAAYCRGPNAAPMDAVCRKVAAHNLSIEGVRLIGSVPGYHKGPEKLKWGHMVSDATFWPDALHACCFELVVRRDWR